MKIKLKAPAVFIAAAALINCLGNIPDKNINNNINNTVKAEDSESAASVIVSLSGGYIAKNDIIPITGTLDKKTSLAVCRFTLEFDPDILEFVDAKSCLGKGVFYYDEGEDTVALVWSNDKNTEAKGALFTANFKARGDAAGKNTLVEVKQCVMGAMENEKMSELSYKSRSSEINIVENYKWGDANCDGKTDLADVVAINRYRIDFNYDLSDDGILNADVNYSGSVNEYDAAAVKRFVSKKSKEEKNHEG